MDQDTFVRGLSAEQKAALLDYRTALQNAYKATESTFRDHNQAMKAEHKTALEALTAELATAKAELKTSQEQLAAMTAERDSLTTQLEAATTKQAETESQRAKQLAELQAQLDTAKSEAESTKSACQLAEQKAADIEAMFPDAPPIAELRKQRAIAEAEAAIAEATERKRKLMEETEQPRTR